jgi:hypothetical protein
MNRVIPAWLVAIALGVACAASGFAQNGEPAGVEDGGAPRPGRTAPALDLAAQVGEISHSTMISRAKKEKRISTAVRVAVVAATAYKQNPEEILGIGVAFATAAAQAAPSFTEVIVNAVAFAPSISGVDGAASRIRTAAFAAARTPKAAPGRRVPSEEYAGAPVPAPEFSNAPAGQTQPESVSMAAPARPAGADSASGENIPPTIAPAIQPKIYWGANSNFSLLGDLSARYDDNLFWTKTNKVSDTIVTMAPGAEYQFGQDSLGHGSLRYQEAFTRYLDNTVPSVNLGTGSADFGYSDTKLTLAGSASFDQLNQNNPDILGNGKQELLRTDTFAAGGSAEALMTGLTSAKVGLAYNHTDFKRTGLINNQNLNFPFNVYFHTTPKLDISTGFTYGEDRPDGGEPRGRDLYYNVGLRGSLTPKLTAEFSVGEQTRNVSGSPGEHLLGFDGSFNYAVTTNTDCVLALSRGFSTSALGQTLVNGSYRLGVTADLTPQWQVGTSLTYRSVDYGATVFTVNNVPVTAQRKDDYWEGGLDVTYEFNRSVKASASYTFRGNHSTDDGADFSNNLLGLTIDLRY